MSFLLKPVWLLTWQKRTTHQKSPSCMAHLSFPPLPIASFLPPCHSTSRHASLLLEHYDKCMQLLHRLFTIVWANSINHELGFGNHNQETAVATALHRNDKICRAMWKRRARSLSFGLCAIERHGNKHVHFSALFSLYCNNSFLAPMDFFFHSILFLRVSMLIKALLPSAVKEIAHPNLACSYWSHCCMFNGLMWPYNHI